VLALEQRASAALCICRMLGRWGSSQPAILSLSRIRPHSLSHSLSHSQTFRSKEISKSNVVDDMVASNAILYEPGEHPDHTVVIK